MNFLENPWKTAEDAVFNKLVTATSSTAKKTAFQGYLPPVPGVWALKVGGGGEVRNTWCETITELRMDADIEAIFTDRATAQVFAMKVLNALPIQRIENVQCFRLRQGGMPDIKFKEVTFANEEKPRLVWAVSIGCEIVFNTVERAT